MVHLYRPRPKNFSVSAVRAVVTVGLARSACTGRVLRGGAVQGVPPGLLLGTTKMVAWRDKVRFLAVAEKHVVRVLFANKKISAPLLGSETARRWSFYGLVFYVHELVQGMTRSPLFFRGPRNTQKWSKQPP